MKTILLSTGLFAFLKEAGDLCEESGLECGEAGGGGGQSVRWLSGWLVTSQDNLESFQPRPGRHLPVLSFFFCLSCDVNSITNITSWLSCPAFSWPSAHFSVSSMLTEDN